VLELIELEAETEPSLDLLSLVDLLADWLSEIEVDRLELSE